MPSLGQTQYYKVTKNGIDSYITNPYGGNQFADPAYQNITKDQYVQGLQQKVSDANAFISKSTAPGYVPTAGAVYTPDDVAKFNQQITDANGGVGVNAPSYVDPAFKAFQPNAPTTSEQYYTPEYLATLAPKEQARINSLYGQNNPITPLPPGKTEVPLGNTFAVVPTTKNQISTYSPAAGYTGSSIVDFLAAAGQASDYASRAKLATQYGISNYSGTAGQNTQLLNILKGMASGNVSSTGLPATVTGGGPTVPTPGSTLDLSKLGGTSLDLSKILGAGSSGSAADDIAGLLSLYGASTKSQEAYNDLQTKLTTALTSMGAEGTDLKAALDQSGYNTDVQQLQQVNLKVAQLKGELDQFDAGTQQGLSDLETQSIPTNLIVGQQAQLQKQRDLTRLSKTAELAANVALGQAYQGNADLAHQLATDAVDIKYKPIQAQIDTLKTQLGFAQESMNREDSQRAKIIDGLLTFKQNEINQQKAIDQQISTLAIQAAANGAPLSVVNAIKGAGDPATAAQLGSRYLKGTLESINGGGGGGGGNSNSFSSTQLNKGASNAGLTLSEFKALSGDDKNFYINSWDDFNTAISAVSDGSATGQSVIDVINSDPISDSMKEALRAQVNDASSSSNSNSGGNGIGNLLGNLWKGIKSFF